MIGINITDYTTIVTATYDNSGGEDNIYSEFDLKGNSLVVPFITSTAFVEITVADALTFNQSELILVFDSPKINLIAASPYTVTNMTPSSLTPNVPTIFNTSISHVATSLTSTYTSPPNITAFPSSTPSSLLFAL